MKAQASTSSRVLDQYRLGRRALPGAAQRARAGGWRAWGTVRGEFGRQLAGQECAANALQVDSEIRRGRDYVRVVIVATVDAADVAEALELAWWTFWKAAGEDLAGWDLARAAAEIRPEATLGTVRLLRGDQRGDNAP